MCRLHKVAAYPKEIVDRAVDGEKALHLSKGFKAAHVPFPLAGGLMRDLGPPQVVALASDFGGKPVPSIQTCATGTHAPLTSYDTDGSQAPRYVDSTSGSTGRIVQHAALLETDTCEERK